MDTFQPTAILPSNAPPWPDLLDNSVLPLAPQDNFCSVQRGPSLSTSDLSECPGGLTSEAPCIQRALRALPRGVPATRLDDFDWRSPNNPSRILIHGLAHQAGACRLSVEEYRAEEKARLLASKFACCEGYIKYRNRQVREKKGSKDQKWPDHIEDAFLRALCRWEPCGRRKKIPPGGTKRMGRNELIAHYILAHTGESRTRKQVSSHIRVLKPFVLGEPMITRYLATPPSGQSAAAKLGRKRRSTYHPNEQVEQATSTQGNNYSMQALLNLQPEEFHMYMRRIDSQVSNNQTTSDEVLHTYGGTDGSYPTERLIESQTDMYAEFLEFACLPIDRFRHGNFLALQVPITLHTQRQLEKAELAISFVFKAPVFDPPIEISSRTRIYKDGAACSYDPTGIPITCPAISGLKFDTTGGAVIPYDDCKGEGREFKQHTNSYPGTNPDNIDPDLGPHTVGMVRYYVPFSSKFWADYLWRTALSHHAAIDAESHSDENLPDEIRLAAGQEKRDEVSAALTGLTAVQEIVASRAGCDSQVVLTVHFKFSHATAGNARTTWEFLDPSPIFSDGIHRSNSSSQKSTCSDLTETYGANEQYFDGAENAYLDTVDNDESLVYSSLDTNDVYDPSWIPSEFLPLSANAADFLPGKSDSEGESVAVSFEGAEGLQTTASATYGFNKKLQSNDALDVPQSSGNSFDYAALFEQEKKAISLGSRGKQDADETVRGPPEPFKMPFQPQAFAGADSATCTYGRIYVKHTETEAFAEIDDQDMLPGNNNFRQEHLGYRVVQDEQVEMEYAPFQIQESFESVMPHPCPQTQQSFNLSPQVPRDACYGQDSLPQPHPRANGTLSDDSHTHTQGRANLSPS